jgi:Secretion system C-terminal sorting domain
MKKITRSLLPIFSLAIVAVLSFFFISFPYKQHPSPTIIKIGTDGENQDARQKWFELMHQAAPGTDWKAMEFNNILQRQRHRLEKMGMSAIRGGEEEEIIPGVLFGEWKERGSINQAGSVLVTEYDKINNKILTVSAGGTLWRGELDGSHWEVINQTLRFNDELLRFIEGPNGRRLIAQSGRVPMFSDDEGLSWTAAEGISFNDGWGTTRHPIVMKDEDHFIYILAKPDYWSNITLYKSTDKGENFAPIQTFNESDLDKYALCNPHGSDNIYMLSRVNNATEIFRINQMTDDLELLSSNNALTLGGVRGNLVGTQLGATTRFYVYDNNSTIHMSEDLGITWVEKGTVPQHPWSVGLFLSPTHPDMLLTGGVECFKSYDSGTTWILMNGWGEYYGDIDTKLHADMMYFNEFNSVTTGEPFWLVSNHGGLSISWDQMITVQNIGKSGLNVGQFYDISTDPTDHNFIYGGSQDQGFQRGFAFDPDEIMEMEQVISGDYGHTVFAKGGDRLWTVYPGGWVTYYSNPQTNVGPTASWDLESDNESVWIPPLLADPDPTKNICYLAGGNMNGGPGSYIIKLEGIGNNIIPSQLPLNFKAESDGEVSAMAISPLNDNLWYAATTNGRFFTSEDRGMTWEQSVGFLPEGHYLYGSAIYPSRVDVNTVYFGGSGYSNSPVFKSTDKGVNFFPMNNGLPPTLIFGMAGDEAENFIYAGTENGPYVYSTADNQWYDLSGLCAPTQTYWSVEYLDEEQLVRFGTYGRGTWDFQVTQMPVATSDLPAAPKLRAYPNPSKGLVYLSVELLSNTPAEQLQVLDMSGKIVFSNKITTADFSGSDLKLALAHLPKGSYVIRLLSKKETSSTTIVLQ